MTSIHPQISELYTLLVRRNTLLHDFHLDYWFNVEHEFRRGVYCSERITNNCDTAFDVYCMVIDDMIKSLRAQISCLSAAMTTKANLSTVLASILQGTLGQGYRHDPFLYPKIQHLLCLAHSSQVHKDVVLSFRGETAENVLCVMMKTMSTKHSLNASHSRATAPYRLSLRRLLLRLSKESGVIPSSLFLQGITCTDKDIPYGNGQFAEVFQARHNGQKVALKRLRVYQSQRNGAEDYESFCRELLVWSQLSHPNILSLLGADKDTFSPRHCMVSLWMNNGNVHECMSALHAKGNRIPYERWLAETSQGLEYLHEEGIVHGDLRGANILVDDYFHIRLADFGLAFFADATTATLGSHLGGAARWMAPELLSGDSLRPTYASDIYSLACACVEILTHKVPFSHILSDIQVIAQVTKGRKPSRPLIQNGASLPEELWNLLQKCWHPRATERPDAQAVAEEMVIICSKDFAQPLPRDISVLAFKTSRPSMKLLLGHARCLEAPKEILGVKSASAAILSDSAVLILTNAPLLRVF
ncbi:hypothetical protein QCA50_001032 [Cerrena zonata]|uniref:Protein kinase domain-containing protein n=1 Tax=Cerrena zonata TaxID=2478898 RepID=A0AAW0GYY5_9APHY